MDLICDNNVDVCCIQESFVRKSDGAIFSEIKDRGFKLHTFRKSHYESHGGGVAVLYKHALNIDKVKAREKYSSFEHIECLVKSEKENVRLVNVYRTPSTSKYGQPLSI